MGVKLWLDDVRPAPEGWVWAKSVHEAIKILSRGDVDEASLDHDLGMRTGSIVGATGILSAWEETAPDGSSLVRWLAETGHWPKTKPRVHSANPVGAAYMRGVIDRYGPY